MFDFNLPLEARNTIALQIRKQIKEYVFKIFRSLTALYPYINTIKNDVFLTSLINDITSLKSFLNSVKQNTQNLHYKLPLNTHSNIFNKNGSIVQNRGRKGRGGRYKSDFKNSLLYTNNNNNYNGVSINNNPNYNINLNNEVNNTDYSDNFEVAASENYANKVREGKENNPSVITENKVKNDFAETKTLGRRRKASSKNLTNEYADLNLSLNEENDNKIIKDNSNNNIVVKKPRGRRKLITNQDSLKFTFEIPLSNFDEIIETNKNIVFYDNDRIVILKNILNTDADKYDRFVIEKNKLEKDILDIFPEKFIELSNL